MEPSAAIARLMLAEARAVRLPWVLLAVLGTAAGLGEFSARLALTEAAQLRVGTTAAVARVGIVATLMVFTVSSVVRERQDGYWRLLFARPLPRRDYILGKLLALATLGAAAAQGAGLLAAVQGSAPAALAWALLLWAEAVLACLFALACALSLQHVLPALFASALFYLAARSSGALLALAANADSPVTAWLARLLPRFDLFARADWLIYPELLPPGWLALQAAVYGVLLLALAVADLNRRQL